MMCLHGNAMFISGHTGIAMLSLSTREESSHSIWYLIVFCALSLCVMQFLSSDGKGQKDLVPVLDTLLKLSPQEKQFIEKAAAGMTQHRLY